MTGKQKRERCGHPISAHRVCCCYPVRGFTHCRHHLTDAERAKRGVSA